LSPSTTTTTSSSSSTPNSPPPPPPPPPPRPPPSCCQARLAELEREEHAAASAEADAEAARRRIAAVPGLLHALVDLAAAPPPESGLLPSRARTSDRLAPGIGAWAAAGALKNLALSSSVRAALQGSAAPHALCTLRASKCWLQSSKSQAALRYLDVDSCEAVLRRPKPPRISLSHVLHLRHFDAPGLVEL